MDPLKTYLGRLVLEELTPVVMVLTTPLVEDSCRKNGLGFVDMLLPFSVFKKFDVPVRTVNDQPYRLQMFKLRMVYASDVRQPNYEAAKEHLKQVVHDSGEKALSDLLSDPPQLETVLSNSESDLCPQWIQTFNKELIRTLSFSEHETFDHPVACLLVVSSKDEQPINKFVDIFNTNQLPSLLNDGLMDPKILKHYVLLHDNQDSSPEKATHILAEMRNTFGPNDCKLLCINSATEDVNNKGFSSVPYKTHGFLGEDIARCLNLEDLKSIKDFMQDLNSNHIIPFMEQKIRILNQQVATTRKGFRNQIKNLWWRKGKDDLPEDPSGSTYTFSSIETQIRILGDYAFILQDYELALSNYRLLSTDYKLDKAWKRYAGVQEMSGLCYFMLDQSRKEAEYCMENAFSTYLRVGSSGQRYASRCGLWWAEMLKARAQYREASGVYFRISIEEPSLHAAVMLEQAAGCYLLSKPPLLRKYGFHLILAGNRYYISDQIKHAIRAYRNALFVYSENAWSYINDHVHFNVGRWYGFLGMFDVAINHMLEVLACGHQSLATQSTFLNDFFHFVQRLGKSFDVCKLQLPVINLFSLKIVYEDHRTYASTADVDVTESLWQALEEEMVPVSTVRANWLDSQPKSSSRKDDDFSICVAGEAVKVEVELKNPLQISISVSSISLICELSASSEASTIDRSVSSAEVQEDTNLMKTSFCSDQKGENSSFTLSKIDVELGGGETKRVQLEVTPKVEGVLKLVGLRWTLSDSVVGYQHFETDAKKKHKKGKRSKHSWKSSLNLIVIKGIPKLEGRVDGFPTKTFAGDLRLLMLSLRNHSEYSLKNIRMKVSHPRFLIPANSADIHEDFPQCLEKQRQMENKDASGNAKNLSRSAFFSFPNDVTIRGGETFSWPLWFHSGSSGNISLYMSIYYEMEGGSSDMTYRTLRMNYNLEVLPSLDISFLISPWPSRLQEYFVRMDVVNRTISETFLLHQLSCVGNQLVISALPSCNSICSMQEIFAGQTLSCFFKLKVLMTGEKNEESVQGSDMLLSSAISNDMLLDVSRSPLSDFHYQERYHQGKLVKGYQSLLDFIMISKMVSSNLDSEEGPNQLLLSNHACHCSISRTSPIWWLMDGPRTIYHEFSSSFCEIDLQLTIHNCSNSLVSIRVATFDSMLETTQSSDAVHLSDNSNDQGGWYDVSLTNDIKLISNVQGSRSQKRLSESTPPFVWSALSSTQLAMEPASTAKLPLKIFVFSPGTYNLSNYELHWKIQPQGEGITDEVKNKSSSGLGQGHPFYLTVLQAP
ncbi:trafficking protein particle complex subunit 8 isoform X1 [Ananas comosus]|uniref:Trafficking protein particle complex subunit 8 isoform X1 n=1 Tax=Ananas comosus TaxID=4615 RepID=A0A6P5FIF1_ANACO|nr:trafficking protein particle complex subunit 8 isoform X1 [Ananas comosus]XP_020095710.1 trafficking protein particle complex subunit 8 isoform X1 [Ananas comosus]